MIITARVTNGILAVALKTIGELAGWLSCNMHDFAFWAEDIENRAVTARHAPSRTASACQLNVSHVRITQPNSKALAGGCVSTVAGTGFHDAIEPG